MNTSESCIYLAFVLKSICSQKLSTCTVAMFGKCFFVYLQESRRYIVDTPFFLLYVRCMYAVFSFVSTHFLHHM